MDTLTEVYKPQWTGQDLLTVQGQNSEMLWADLAHKLSDQVLIPLNTYQGQFPEMRKKIEKRGRKLIDYDKERHNVQTLQANPNRNEAKYARYHTYEIIIITFYALHILQWSTRSRNFRPKPKVFSFRLSVSAAESKG